MIENDDQRAITAYWVKLFLDRASTAQEQYKDDPAFAKELMNSYTGMANTLEEEVIDYDERKTRQMGD
jgi:hypothetical protein